MSFLIAAPQLIADAATDLTNLGSTIGSANSAAVVATTGVLPAAADEVSAEIASLFSAHAAGYQQLSAQAAAFHEQFVQILSAGGTAYASAEAEVVATLAGAAPGLSVELGGGLSGLGAGIGAEIAGLSGSFGAALSGGFGGGFAGFASVGTALTADLSGGFSALAQTGGSLVSSLGGGWSGLSGGLSGLGGVWSGLSGGLSGLGGGWSGLSGSLGTALSGGLSLSGTLQAGGSLMAQLGGLWGISPGLGASISAGLSGLGAQFSAALSGGLSAELSAIPGALAHGFGSWEALFTSSSPAAFMSHLQAMETSFNSGLIGGEFNFNTSLVSQELAIETAIFGGPGALSGALDGVFNFWNGMLGTGEISFNSLIGAQFCGPVGLGPIGCWSNPWFNFVSGLYVPGSTSIGNGGLINGLMGALDQKFLWDLNVADWVAGLFPGGGAVQAALQLPIGGLQGWAGAQVSFLGNLNAMESTFNGGLVNSELGWEDSTFGCNAFGGALDRTFNVGNLFVSTGQQTFNSMLGAAPNPALSTVLTGSRCDVFNGGNIGGLEGIFDQSLAAGFDFAGLL